MPWQTITRNGKGDCIKEAEGKQMAQRIGLIFAIIQMPF